ncbi:hypothetical protein [Sorangium cellulosum]|uniref:SMODS and SLOG-associating 2TM effector domain-containing protein n=1 Tax=Sorangium cellulosum So0157-2 TaxID=1254432 RepID=S4Y378_SORCE|nr:hypothetical protein [Sorangium cellulosum]AGP38650.1 hypothetical protein SCE1572_31725 [Sorangium cellulosum So0157-2]
MAASILAVQDASAEPKDDGLKEQVELCNKNVEYFQSRVDSVVTWSNVFMIAGALISATGSALAGFLNSASRRKAAAIVGALGAVLTVTPKALPDKEKLLASLGAAEKHRLVGMKIRNQFQFARPGESLVDAQKYVSARFTDCASLEPPQGVPELPSLASVSPVESSAPVAEPQPMLMPSAAPAPSVSSTLTVPFPAATTTAGASASSVPFVAQSLGADGASSSPPRKPPIQIIDLNDPTR